MTARETFPNPVRVRPTLREIMDMTPGVDGSSYRPSANPGACFPTALDLPRRQRVDGLIHDLNVAYSAKGHAK